MKQIVIQGKLIRYDLAELREVTRPFRMIGNELNQIAKKSNETFIVHENGTEITCIGKSRCCANIRYLHIGI